MTDRVFGTVIVRVCLANGRSKRTQSSRLGAQPRLRWSRPA